MQTGLAGRVQCLSEMQIHVGDEVVAQVEGSPQHGQGSAGICSQRSGEEAGQFEHVVAGTLAVPGRGLRSWRRSTESTSQGVACELDDREPFR